MVCSLSGNMQRPHLESKADRYVRLLLAPFPNNVCPPILFVDSSQSHPHLVDNNARQADISDYIVQRSNGYQSPVAMSKVISGTMRVRPC